MLTASTHTSECEFEAETIREISALVPTFRFFPFTRTKSSSAATESAMYVSSVLLNSLSVRVECYVGK